MIKKKLPDFSYELSLWDQQYYVIGIDEVGRGALAGPVYVGAVCFQPSLKTRDRVYYKAIKVNDSKQLSKKMRDKLSKDLKNKLRSYSICYSPVVLINKVGIIRATEMAFRKAIEEIRCAVGKEKEFFLLADGFPVRRVKGLGLRRQQAIVRGDGKSITIAAASILAKVERDRVMDELAGECKEYGWGKNKGYGTKAHINAIKKHGLSKHHRKLFVRKILP